MSATPSFPALLQRFFTDRLIEAGVDPVTAEKDACRMEHVISQESFEHLKNAYKTKEE